MALWYKELKGGVEAFPERKPVIAKAQLHLNLWRQTTEETDDSNFLDIGLLLEDVAEIENIFLFVPIDVQEIDIEDLSVRMRRGNLLSAVFNEVMEITEEDEDGTYSTRDRKGDELTIHAFKMTQDVNLEKVDIDQGERGTILRFRSSFCKRLKSKGRNYLRLRFLLDRAATKEFSLNTRGKGYAIISTVLSEELTELRFNEMRNMPLAVLAKIDRGKLFTMHAAHCFLIRDRSFELVAAHSHMHKMRRMEAKLWRGYLPEKLAKTDLSKMMVYHWRTTDKIVESFITLARFKRQRDTLGWYIVGVMMLGGIGSAIEASLASHKYNGKELGSLWALFWLCVVLAGAAAFPEVKVALRRLWFYGWRKWERRHIRKPSDY